MQLWGVQGLGWHSALTWTCRGIRGTPKPGIPVGQAEFMGLVLGVVPQLEEQGRDGTAATRGDRFLVL